MPCGAGNAAHPHHGGRGEDGAPPPSAGPGGRGRASFGGEEVAAGQLAGGVTRPTWLNACGVLPSWRPKVGSHSSASRSTSLRRASSRSNNWCASFPVPGRAGRRRARSWRPGKRLDAGRSVDAARGAAARDKPVLAELALLCGDGAGHALVGPRQEADPRDQQQRGVDAAAVVVLGGGGLVGVGALVAHVAGDVLVV